MLIGVMDSSVMYLALWIAHSLFCSTRMARYQAGDGVLVGEDADDVGSALDLAMEPFQLVVECSLARCSLGRLMQLWIARQTVR